MRRPRTVPGPIDCFGWPTGEQERHWRKPHDASVPSRVRISWSAVRLLRPFEVLEAAAGRRTDVETAAFHTPMTFAIPANVSCRLVDRVEAGASDQALGQAQRHGRVVRPLARPEVEWPAPDNGCERLERPGQREFDRCAEGIPGRQSEQGAAIARPAIHRRPSVESVSPAFWRAAARAATARGRGRREPWESLAAPEALGLLARSSLAACSGRARSGLAATGVLPGRQSRAPSELPARPQAGALAGTNRTCTRSAGPVERGLWAVGPVRSRASP